ncbi:GNAT family N-acetyltransferase [Streptomyces violaceusniger]|uniref:GCN5-related N-acetyltransferase n=1 Tax=Streptomyces violaceusniger (strain Tu 4113) TaxID=653045 RepID=G2PEZ8_STRV4|nr:GNAT family N-acetyltransferase [Streptomyces violaceusniger]AEM84004.1 GCN5-related N-acetyltransferase [Streptomyces violaceusniger Tu 4113]
MSLRITPLTDPAHGPHSQRLAWLASDAESIPVGTAFLRLFTDPGQEHLAELTLRVHPAERRKCVGSRLLDAAVGAARDSARRCVIAQAEAVSPGDHFLVARGFRKVLTLRFSRLPLGDVDTTALAEIIERPHPGYRLVSWQGTVPDGLAQTFATSRHAMDDMPMDDTDYGTVTWDVDRVRAAAKVVEQRGDQLHTVVAIDASNGSIAAFTELVIPGNGTGDGQHYGTGVLPEHRGHGLGRWMKAESIRQAHGHYPDLGGLLTDTADSNTHMRQINDSLGYTPTHTTHQHQLDL